MRSRLSPFPFVTAWLGEAYPVPAPAAVYGVVLLMAAIAWYILQLTIIAAQGPSSILRTALGRDWKGKLSPAIYLVAMPLSFVNPWVAIGLYSLVALLWIIPDRRFERLPHERPVSH